MTKNNKYVWIGIAILALFLIGNQAGLFAVGSGSMTRSVPSTVSPGQSFRVTYTVSGVSGTWGASIVDDVSGGCQFPGGSQLKTVMLSADGNSKQITLTAPSSGSCTFSGDYKFGEDAVVNFPSKTVTISEGNGDEDDNGEEPGDDDEIIDDGEIPSFDLNKPLFKLGTFDVTILHLIILVGLIFVLKLVLGK
ncbi:unnamed protein product [marine sediment metagenome]|uniref:Uncharacterized protein n=1 Tax=marine sediment metagenome TaxID=412755 RepID=X0XLD5_9ZZZZ